jgi:hypothetical protein
MIANIVETWHLKNVFQTNELAKDSAYAKIAHTDLDSKSYIAQF